MALYESLTAQSTPEQIAAAYKEYTGMVGGDTQAAQEAATNYLTNLGISAPTITQAYQQYISPVGALAQATSQPASTQENINPYFVANPDVAAAYNQNTYGMSPEQFAQTHYEKYGKLEGREAPTGLPPANLTSQILGSAVQDKDWTGYGYGNKAANAQAISDWLQANGINDLTQLGVKTQQIADPVRQIGKQINGQAIGSYIDDNGDLNYFYRDAETGQATTLSKEQVDKADPLYGIEGFDFDGSVVTTPVDSSKISIVDGQPVIARGARPEFYNKQTGKTLFDIPYGGKDIHYVADEALPSDFKDIVPGQTYTIGRTFAGKGGTNYNVVFDQQGKPHFFTSWSGPTSDVGNIAPILALASFIPGVAPFAQAANALIALDQGNEAGALLSALGAYGSYTSGQLGAMTNPSSAAAVSGLDLASDIATLGANPALALQTTLADINLAKTAVAGLNAAQTGNAAGLINSALSGYTQLGGTLPSGVTTGLQVANLATALDKGDVAGALNAAGDLANSQNARIAASGADMLNALKSGNPAAVIQAATSFGKTAAEPGTPSMPGGGYQYSSLGTPFADKPTGITARTYDDTIVSAGAKAFEDAKRAGATDEEAIQAANAVTTPAKPAYDQGEFEGLDQAQAAARAASTVAIGNAEADTPEEAMALARARNPNAGSFTFGGQEYTITGSAGQMAEMTRNAQLAEIKDSPTFSEAYAKARNVLGPNQQFEWGGKQYSTATFAERPDLGGDIVPGKESATAGAGRGSYAGYDSAEDVVNKVKSTPTVTEYSGPKVLGIPIGTPQDAINTVNRMGEVVLDFSRGIGAGFGNFMNQVGTLAHIASASASGGDTTNTLIGRDNLLSSLGRDLAAYYNGMTTEQSNKEWGNIVKDVNAAPEYLKPFVAIQSTLQNFGGFVNRLGGEVGEEVAPIMTGLGIGSKLLQLGASGTAKTIAVTSTLGDMAESAQGSYDNVMNRLKDNKNLTPEEKHWAATQAAAGSMAATAVFGYGANAYLAKSIMGDMVGNTAQKVLGPLAVEYVTEYPESFIQTLNERFAEKGSIDARDIRDANTDGAISALLGSKTSGAIAGTVQVVGRVSNEFVGAGSGEKSGIAVVQSPDGKTAFVPAGDLKVGQEVNADNLIQLQTPSEVVDQFNFSPDDAARIKESVSILDSTREQRQDQAAQEEANFNPADIDINSALLSESDAATQVKPGTTTITDTKAGVTTQTTTTPETKTTVTTDVNNNTQTTVVVDVKTGDIVSRETKPVPDGWTAPDTASLVAAPSGVTPQTTTSPDQAAKTAASKTAMTGAAGLAGGMGAMLPSSFEMDPTLLPSRVTQKAIDPIQRVMEAQAELENTAMMQQIDPRLLSVLQQRMAPEQQANQQQQFDKDIGALSRLLSGQTEAPANENNYYSYGSESSIDDILGGRAVGYKDGGYVAPLMAQGGMALPLLAKSGGALDHYQGRENFKEGKHVAGEGDGQSDDIPAWLADGEFVFPADVVSALGNGSTKAGTDKLYEMMHNIRDRARSTGEKDLPPPALKSPLDYLKSHKRSK